MSWEEIDVNKRIAGVHPVVAVVLSLVLTAAHMSAAQAPGNDVNNVNNVLRVLCSTALRTVMQELVPEFERSTGNKVTVEYGVSTAMQRRVEAGEPFDAI